MTVRGKAIQIVGIENGIQLYKDKLSDIVSPINHPIVVWSVVGAFRTGKSFLLDLLIRCLDALERGTVPIDCLEGGKLRGGMVTQRKCQIERDQLVVETERDIESGFSWRSGRHRCTVGIWMWSRPFIINGQAILLIDTQGMFDSTLGSHATASIFGLSTLLSSIQVYNVDKRIQEDNLQHLALFSEYARLAHRDAGDGDGFSKLWFLVRDWQNFDTTVLCDTDEEKIASMKKYCDEVMEERKSVELEDVRKQIRNTFPSLNCWLLPHPGLDVCKARYDGSLRQIRMEFRNLLSKFAEKLVNESSRSMTSREFLMYSESYTEVFSKGDAFPKATHIFNATIQVNEDIAIQKAIEQYECDMKLTDQYMLEETLQSRHLLALEQAHNTFIALASFGMERDRSESIERLQRQLENQYDNLKQHNTSLKPYRNAEWYVVPVTIALLSWICHYVFSWFCPHKSTEEFDFEFADICQPVMELFQTTYRLIFSILILLGGSTIIKIWNKVKNVLPLQRL